MIKEFLLFVEDPGALNLIIDLPGQLRKYNIDYEIVANGYAANELKKNNIKFNFIDNKKHLLKYLNKYNFKNFIITTSENRNSLGLFLIDYSRSREIISIGLVDMVANYKYRFCGNSEDPLRFKPDKIIATDKLTKNSFVSLGMKYDDVFYCNHPQIERIKDKQRRFIKKNKIENLSANRWLFIAENIDLLNPDESFYSREYTFQGRGDTKWRTGIILEEILDSINLLEAKPDLYIRLHPKNKKEQFMYLKNEVKFDEVIDPIDSVLSSSVILGMTSNLLVESLICKKPVLSILPRYKEKSWLSELNTNLIKSVFTKTELDYSINNLALGNFRNFKKNYNPEKIESLLNTIFLIVN